MGDAIDALYPLRPGSQEAQMCGAVVGRAVAYSNLAEVKQRLGALPEAAR